MAAPPPEKPLPMTNSLLTAEPSEHEQPYAVAAAESLQEMRTLTLKNGDTFAVFNRSGDIAGRAGSPEGVFHRDTRHLSQFVLTIDGAKPMLLSATHARRQRHC